MVSMSLLCSSYGRGSCQWAVLDPQALSESKRWHPE